MLEVKIPGIRHGLGYAGEDLQKGTWVRPSGTFSSGDITTIQTTSPAQANAAGFANAGDIKIMQSVLGDVQPSFPVNKLQIAPEDADSDDILAGEGVIYYIGGEYETDQYTSVSGTGGGPGDFLKIGNSGKLVEETTPSTVTTSSVAQVVRMFHGIDANNVVRDRLWFRMINK
jgi:hypothetical protein